MTKKTKNNEAAKNHVKDCYVYGTWLNVIKNKAVKNLKMRQKATKALKARQNAKAPVKRTPKAFKLNSKAINKRSKQISSKHNSTIGTAIINKSKNIDFE
jgi:hypothetical protein